MIATSARRLEIALFLTLFVAYAWFHQGGGWNQNVRFDQVRALVETGQWHINDFFVYASTTDADGRARLKRLSVPENVRPDTDLPLPNSADVAMYKGRFFPNKPPGTTLLAAPAYAAVLLVERSLGRDPDDPWLLTLNAHLTTVFSVGLLGAVGGVVYLRVSRRLFPAARVAAHAMAALAFGLGTIFWPFGTMLFDHVPAAVLSLASFAVLVRCADELRSGGAVRSAWMFASGWLAGFSVATNYACILTVLICTIYAAANIRRPVAVGCFLLGGLIPAAFLMVYHAACFGQVFVIANQFQPPVFRSEPSQGHLLGVFGVPGGDALRQLLISPHRGLFVSAPVMLLAPWGAVKWLLGGTRKAEGVAALCIVLLFLLMNASFNAWHGGNGYGPRYLIPALPFACLPIALVLARFRLTAGLAAISALLMLIAVTVDPQVSADQRQPLLSHWLPLLRGRDHRGDYIGPVSANPLGMHEGRFLPQQRGDIDRRRWHSYNVGEFLAPGSAWSVAPMLLLIATGCGYTLRTARQLSQGHGGAVKSTPRPI